MRIPAGSQQPQIFDKICGFFVPSRVAKCSYNNVFRLRLPVAFSTISTFTSVINCICQI